MVGGVLGRGRAVLQRRPRRMSALAALALGTAAALACAGLACGLTPTSAAPTATAALTPAVTGSAAPSAAVSLSPSTAATSTPAAVTGTPPSRWVAVSVATLWVKPGLARSIDAPACSNPAYPRRWVASMTTPQKRWLNGKLETQALYGTRVYVLATSGSWTKVAVSGQPTPRSGLGYPGWLPTRQLTTRAPVTGLYTAVIRRPTAWLWRTSALTGRVIELSYATRLPAVRWTATSVEVAMLDGRHLYVARSAVALHAPGTAWPAVTGAVLVREAKRFLGLQYLYGGTSGFGFDCSGFTHTVFSALGKTIPRDADAQAIRGVRVASRSALRPGDLVFFRYASGYIHHVGMYVGGGVMIHSPSTGQAVRLASIFSEPYYSQFAGGRRYVTSL